MEQWEHRIETAELTSDDAITHTLNALGTMGWQAAALAFPKAGWVTIVMKRPVDESIEPHSRVW
jgi:hypothetical protein